MITDPVQRERLIERFAFLRQAAPAFRDDFFGGVSLATLPAGQLICRDGAQCSHLPLVIEGTGRIYKVGENGREITLYRIAAGESCVLTASCLLGQRLFPAFAECETPVVAALVSAGQVGRWIGDCGPWRQFIFALIADRLDEIFGVIDAVLFQRLDQRLAAFLLRRAEDQPKTASIAITHQELAVEIGSSREVVTRLLKDLEGASLVRTSRGRIDLLDRPALEAKARAGNPGGPA
ncbi:Crp/Fnr family transcriptional regulator [Thioalkalicoccus limnaeus]|uniref:Crp/Fnr family transcriptional regulator n=1 Tax=Thioalkalicoccus limnaeus TaxID=120681 RepID=A0ABV4BH62_9GAMM